LDGTDVWELHDNIEIDLTASSVSVNRESDRQNMVQLAMLFEKYANAKVQLAVQEKQGMPSELIKSTSDAMDAIWKRIVRTFDQISDARKFQIDLPENSGLQGMGALLGQMQPPPQAAPAPEQAAA
jgi:hypothetical protein